MPVAEEPAGATAIRPFTIKIPEAEIEALRARITATRWPSRAASAQIGPGAVIKSPMELKTAASTGPGAAHPFHECTSGSRPPRRQAC